MGEIHKLSCAIHDSQSCNCGLPERAMGEPAKTLREIVDQYLDRLLPPSARARIEADLLSWAQARERRYGERVRDSIGIAVAREFGADDDDCGKVSEWVHGLPLPEPETEQQQEEEPRECVHPGCLKEAWDGNYCRDHGNQP